MEQLDKSARSDKRNERGIASRKRILLAATELFARDGFGKTSIEEILRECNVSRGALYHHFANKEALFTAVLEDLEQKLCASLREASKGAADPLDGLRLGCNAWLELTLDPAVRQIALIDAPNVVGWEAWREIDARNGLGLIKKSLDMGAQMSLIRAPLIDVYAHMLLAALGEFALLIARSEHKSDSLSRAKAAIETMLSGIFRDQPGAH